MTDTILIVQGVEEADTAASCAPDGVSVLPLGSLTDPANADRLHDVDGKQVVIITIADVTSNAIAYDAVARLGETAHLEGATAVRYCTIPDPLGRLGARPVERRRSYLENLIRHAKPRLPRRPAASRSKEPAEVPDEGFFDHNGLKVRDLYVAIVDRYPAALTREHRVALYRNGVFNTDSTALSGVVGELLDNRFRPSHRSAVEEYATGALFNEGRILPECVDVPLLNLRNGMLDLATGALKPHDPAYMSSTQLPIVWDPDATCPTYDKWIVRSVGDQVDDLEEATSTMLDPSRTPSKAVFLFGPSRSGKSTYLRLMQAVAGVENFSAVTLHQLSDNRFAAANVYLKVLNCAADLSAAHVEDMSIFKMMTGEDPIQADRKFGNQFAFVNRALFAFSANELPTVSESSNAYIERIKPFHFPHSFAGSEDPTIEARMMQELPGIVARWVRAWQRLADRGHFLATNQAVRKEFEVRSDRVRQFVTEHAEIQAVLPDGQAVSPGAEVPMSMATTQRAFAQAFNRWAKDNNAPTIGERKIKDRLTSIKGVFEVRRMPGSVRALNVTLRADADASWPAEPESDSAVPAKPAVSNPLSESRVIESANGDGGQGPLFLAHGGKCGETAGTAGDSWPDDTNCPDCRFPKDSRGHLDNCQRAA